MAVETATATRAERARTGAARLCLNMIVKDESAIIERCLEAAAPAIACAVVCDTGSTDDTRERVAASLAARGIPCEIHGIPFGDFSTARNRALDLARASALAYDYLLLVDADMELEIADADFRAGLRAAAYRVRQHNGLSYWNARLLHREAPARYVGATHEYLAVDAPVEALAGIAFADRGDGSSRAVKVERDLALLRAALASAPGDARSMFYLAQTLRDAGRHDEARDWYRRRIDAGGFDEEVWYAMLMHARCCAALGDGVGFVDGCLSAYEFRPSRAEPLADLARYYREAGQHETAMLYVEAGEQIPYPAGDVLFVDDAVYLHAFRHETSVSGYYCRNPARRRAAREAVLELQIARDVPADLRQAARNNGRFYAPRASDLLGPMSVSPLALPIDYPWSPANPSLWLDGDDLVAAIRTVNYHLDDPDRAGWKLGTLRTRNFLARLSRDGEILDAREIVPAASIAPPLPSRVEGFEDLRLFRWRGALRGTATVRDRNDAMRCEIALVTLDDAARIVDLAVLHGYGDDLHQKNWMPAVDGDELWLVYACDPTTVLRFDPLARAVTLESKREPGVALEHLRGGSQLVPFDAGWLALTHEVAAIDAHQRRYLHRFVRFDPAFRIDAITEPFRLADEPIEFAAGLAFDAARDLLYLSYGVMDARAELAMLAAAGVRRALVALPHDDHARRSV
jgi:glycosyltransferase involved in cell wall biosynthesis